MIKGPSLKIIKKKKQVIFEERERIRRHWKSWFLLKDKLKQQFSDYSKRVLMLKSYIEDLESQGKEIKLYQKKWLLEDSESLNKRSDEAIFIRQSLDKILNSLDMIKHKVDDSFQERIHIDDVVHLISEEIDKKEQSILDKRQRHDKDYEQEEKRQIQDHIEYKVAHQQRQALIEQEEKYAEILNFIHDRFVKMKNVFSDLTYVNQKLENRIQTLEQSINQREGGEDDYERMLEHISQNKAYLEDVLKKVLDQFFAESQEINKVIVGKQDVDLEREKNRKFFKIAYKLDR